MTVAEAFTTTRYRCPFCRRSWSSKARANEHVAACWKDPAQRTCKTCLHHDEGEAGSHWEPPSPEGCLVYGSFPEGHVFLDRDGEPTDFTDDAWWPQRHCPLWEPAVWIKEPVW